MLMVSYQVRCFDSGRELDDIRFFRDIFKTIFPGAIATYSPAETELPPLQYGCRLGYDPSEAWRVSITYQLYESTMVRRLA